MPTLSSDQRALLEGALARSVAAGLIGGPDLAHHLDHALGFAAAIVALQPAGPGACLDLGSGGGLPGSVVAVALPGWQVVLLEAAARRCRVLEEITDDLRATIPDIGLTVVHGRAEDIARTELRGTCDVVTARSFGPPAVTAECAVGFLRSGGALIVSEPPEQPQEPAMAVRWPEQGLRALGFSPALRHDSGPEGLGRWAVLTKHEDSDDWPRRNGLPGRRPLW